MGGAEGELLQNVWLLLFHKLHSLRPDTMMLDMHGFVRSKDMLEIVLGSTCDILEVLCIFELKSQCEGSGYWLHF